MATNFSWGRTRGGEVAGESSSEDARSSLLEMFVCFGLFPFQLHFVHGLCIGKLCSAFRTLPLSSTVSSQTFDLLTFASASLLISGWLRIAWWHNTLRQDRWLPSASAGIGVNQTLVGSLDLLEVSLLVDSKHLVIVLPGSHGERRNSCPMSESNGLRRSAFCSTT